MEGATAAGPRWEVGPGGRVADVLAGRRMLVTGVTGFVGEALLERVLSDLPDTRLVLLVRGKDGFPAPARAEQLLSKPAFGPLRERIGDAGMARLLAERIEVLDGDLERWPALPGDLDVVVHCAGEVSFDPAIDDAFTTNALGVQRLLEAVAASGSRPHVVHVSTAYVNGTRRGPVPEASLVHDVDWRTEAAAAARLRLAVEDSSRTAAALGRFNAEARKEVGREGPAAVAAEAERRRRAWVDERLVAAGRERAQSLGWTDCYTFTKAMGERVAEELTAREGLPLTVVRPSIIESALLRPYPGWIEGYKMAEPIILAYGRGELPEFPAVPDGVVDIIPVDLVVAATLAAAASPPEPGDRQYFHLSSGARNPLSFADLYRNVRDYFQRHPLEARDRGTLAAPVWRFPGIDKVERLLKTGERLTDTVDKAVSRLPRSGAVRSAVLKVDRQRAKLEFLRRYFDLYAPYTSAEVIYRDDRTAALSAALAPGDAETWAFDPRAIDWKHYLVDVHCPSVTGLIRSITGSKRGARDRVDADLPERRDVVAVFDMDGTLLPSNVVESYLRLRLADVAPPERAREVARAAWDLPGWLAAERRDRTAFLRAVYKRYEGAAWADLERLVDDEVADDILRRASGAAVRRVRQHRAAGHRTVLVTGALTPLARPLAPLFDEVVAVDLELDEAGRCTGHLAGPPPVGQARAEWLRAYADVHGFDLGASYAYADSASDLPLLRVVGRPVAVNPDAALLRVARASRWPVHEWPTGGRAPRQLTGAAK